jgi:hypothetical protein
VIQDFDNLKKQLLEMAGVINSFKSEAVQLRIVELILGVSPADPSEVDDKGSETMRRGKLNRPIKRDSDGYKAAKKGNGSSGRKAASGTGSVATLAQLAETAFFDTPRTLNDIVEHCKHTLARTFKANEFSGKLGRMIRTRELTRQKNADHQYEYKKP